MNEFIWACVIAAIFAIYVGLEVALFGIPKSISNSFYLYNGIRKNLGYVFTLFMFVEAFLLAPLMLKLSADSPWQFLSFLCPAGLLFCGSAPFSEGVTLESRVHSIGAISAAVLGLIWCCLFIGLHSTLVTLFVALWLVCLVAFATMTLRTSKVFWIEIAGFSTILFLLIRYTY